MSCDEKGPRTATECTPCSPNVRNRYFRGKLMTVADYQAEQLYMVQRRRVVNRMVLGWGVVSGFHVDEHGDGLTISPGMALDPCGREIVACEPVTIKERDDVLWLHEGKCGPESGSPFEAGCYILSAHYAERHVNGVRVPTGCDDSECETNHICETVVYSLSYIHSKHPPIRVLECTDLEPNPDEEPTPAPASAIRPHVGPVDNRGQGNLCIHDPFDWGDRRFKPCGSCQLARYGDLELDAGAGVALAIVCFDLDECDKPVFGEVQQIIRGCELTRIQDIGWRNWHEHPDIVIELETFRQMFADPPDAQSGQSRQRQKEPDNGESVPVDTRFWICFSAPVQVASLRRDVMSITIVQLDKNEEVLTVERVPIVGIWCQPTRPGDPPNTTRGFRPLVAYAFWWGELLQGARRSLAFETLVEIRIEGDKIIDWAGRPIDGNAVAQHLPSGNGTPGGEFLSSWRVQLEGSQMPPRGAQGSSNASPPDGSQGGKS
jgi:hypothetical protein